MAGNISPEQVRQFLKRDFISPSQEWLSDCIKFYCESNTNPVNLLQRVCQFAKDQWLLNDIAETVDPARPCLPPNLIQQKSILLSDCYALQVNNYIDVGTSSFKQIQNLLKVTPLDVADNDEQSHFNEVSGQRTLKLSMTDGKQQIFGLEYNPLKNLNIKNIVPGFKILIKGPVHCRRGILMLKSHNVAELGGHVESIFEANDQLKLLTAKLSNPEFMSNSNELAFHNPKSEKTNIVHRNTYNHNNFNSYNDRKPTFTNRVQPANLNDDDIDALMAQIPEVDDPFIKVESTPKRIKISPNNRSDSNSNTPIEIFDDPFDVDLDEILLEEVKVEEIRKNISELNKMNSFSKRDKTFIVKAQMQSALTKLQYKQGKWGMKCRLTDGTGLLDVTMDDDIITKLLKEVGYNEKMDEIRKEVDDPAVKQRLSKALLDLKLKMAGLGNHYIIFKENEAFATNIVNCDR